TIIVGVVGGTRHMSVKRAPRPSVYLPIKQSVNGPDGVSLVIQPRRGSVDVMPRVRDAVRALDPELPVVRVTSLDRLFAQQLDTQRFYLVFLSIFGGLAVVLAVVGIYGVVAYVTSLRTREFGIRIALGARVRQVHAMVVRQALRPVFIGLAGGLACAWWLTSALAADPSLKSLLFEISPHDPWSLTAAAVLFLV